MFKYKFARPAVTVDIALFGVSLSEPEPTLDVLLVRRAEEPFEGQLTLPGGFVDVTIGESLDDAAFRNLKKKTGIVPAHLEQLYTFGDPKRDPRERIVTVAYMALVPSRAHVISVGENAQEVAWFDVRSLDPVAAAINGPVKVEKTVKKTRRTVNGKRKTFAESRYKITLSTSEKLAFDHESILEIAYNRLRAKVRYAPIGFDLLPATFTMAQLQRLYETVLQTDLDKSNFRKKVIALDILAEAGKSNGPGKSATLYRFDADKYEAALASGINFEL